MSVAILRGDSLTEFCSVYAEKNNYGVMQVDRESLELTWLVGDVTIDDGALYGYEPTSPQAMETVCTHSPRLWSAELASNSSSSGSNRTNGIKQKPWSLLFYTQQVLDVQFLLGFASSRKTTPASQSFL